MVASTPAVYSLQYLKDLIENFSQAIQQMQS